MHLYSHLFSSSYHHCVSSAVVFGNIDIASERDYDLYLRGGHVSGNSRKVSTCVHVVQRFKKSLFELNHFEQNSKRKALL